MHCTQFTDNTFVEVKDVDEMDWYLNVYLVDLFEKMDEAVGIAYAAAVVEEGMHLHAHTIFWTAKKITFDYARKIVPKIHYEDAARRLSINLDYLHKRNGFEDKGHTNRSTVIELGEYPLTEEMSVPSEWVYFIQAGKGRRTYREVVDKYPSVIGRAYGVKAYIEEYNAYMKYLEKEAKIT